MDGELSTSCGKILGENHFAESKCMFWTFLYPIFFCWATYWALVKLFLEHYLRVPILVSSFSTLCQQNVHSNFFSNKLWGHDILFWGLWGTLTLYLCLIVNAVNTRVAMNTDAILSLSLPFASFFFHLGILRHVLG
jgi:hypothetical protein